MSLGSPLVTQKFRRLALGLSLVSPSLPLSCTPHIEKHGQEQTAVASKKALEGKKAAGEGERAEFRGAVRSQTTKAKMEALGSTGRDGLE